MDNSAEVNHPERNEPGQDSAINTSNPEINHGAAMSTENGVQLDDEQSPKPEAQEPSAGALQLRPSSSMSNRPVLPSDLEVEEMISVAGVRPIAKSNLQVYGMLLGNRPISASSIKVYDQLPGDRPIFYSDVKMVPGAFLPGNRPIMASDPKLLEGGNLPGNRPIASNDIDDAPNLMGFLD